MSWASPYVQLHAV